MIMITPGRCLRCGHSWVQRKPNPIYCPSCKSPYWNRKRRGEEKPAPTAKYLEACPRCRRVGLVKDCQECKALNSVPNPLPGEEISERRYTLHHPSSDPLGVWLNPDRDDGLGT